jgi:hypothetical protein
MDILRFLHSWNRWLIVVVAVVAVVYFALGWLQKRPWDKNAGLLIRVFPILMDIQWLLGLLLIGAFAFASGNFSFQTIIRHMWEHGFAMTIAVVVAHLSAIWRKRELPDDIRYRNNLFVVVGTIVVIILGIFVLPAAIQWRFFTGA